jgi:hypothetical protein
MSKNELDSYFKPFFGQDIQDHQDFSFLSQFPEETEKTQSDCVGNEYLPNIGAYSD